MLRDKSEKASAAESLVGKNAMSGFLALMNAGEGDINKLSSAIANCDGSAANMASTMNDNLEGQLTILKSQLQELAISFGEMLMPAIRTIVGWIQGFVDKLNSMDEGTRKVIITIALVAAAIGPVLIVIGKIMSAVGTIMTIVPKLASVIGIVQKAFMALNATMLANPIVLIIAAIAALVAAFIYLWNNCEEFRQFWIDLWENIKAVAEAVWEGLKAFFQAAWEAIKSTAEVVWNGIKDFFSGLWDGIKNIFTTVVNAISTFLSGAWTAIQTTVSTVWNAISTFFSTIWTTIKTTFTTVVTAIGTFLSTAWNGIKTTITTVMNAIKTVVTTVWNGIKTAISSAVNAVKNVVSAGWNTIKDTVSSVGNAIKNGVTTVWNNVTSAVKNAMGHVFDAVKSGFGNVKDHITGLASQAFNWGKDLIMGIVNGIKSCISAVGDAVKAVAQKIKSFLHFSVPDEGPLTDYESWMPDFMKGLAKGIEESKGMVTRAMDSLSADMVISPQVNGMQASLASGGTVSSSDLSGLVSAVRDAVSGDGVGGGSTGGDIVIPVYLGGTMLDEVIVNAQQRANLRSGGR